MIMQCLEHPERSDKGAFIRLPDSSIVADLLKAHDGDGCPRCEVGVLKSCRAVELGHTFYLGTKYSAKLDARVTIEDGNTTADSSGAERHPQTTFLEMGCHGIGISRNDRHRCGCSLR